MICIRVGETVSDEITDLMLKRAILFALVSLCVLPLSAQTTFIRDTFTGANGTFVESHTPDIGGAWTRLRGLGVVLDRNQATPNKVSSFDVYRNAATPPASEYVVGTEAIFGSLSTDNRVELYARLTAGGSGYAVIVIGSGTYEIVRYDNGTPTVLTSGTTTALNAVDTVNEIVFSVTDAAKTLIINGTAIATSTDNTITGAGLAGFGINTRPKDDAIIDDFYASTFAPTAVRMDAMRATRSGRRALIDWTTGREIDSLGYRIWREDASGRTRVTPSLVAGAAFFADRAQGNHYRWIDEASRPRATYWIEEVGVRGTSAWYGPIVPQAGAFDDRAPRTPLLGELSQRVSVAAERTSVPRIETRASDRGDAARRTQFDLAARGAVKISVTAPGWYEVSLAATPLASADPRKLQLYEDGVEIPIESAAGAIRFYGRPNDTPSSGTRVYWLVNGPGNGLRIARASAGAAPLAGATSFLATVERRDKQIFFATLRNGDADSFFGPIITSDPSYPARQQLRLQHLDRAARTADLEVGIQGGTATAHRVAIALNGRAAGEALLTGTAATTAKFTVPSDWLLEGDNTIELTSRNGDDDVSVVSFVRITYAHTYTADGGALLFTAPGGTRVPLAGFDGAFRALDITDPSAPIELAVDASSVTVAGRGTRTILAISAPRNDARVETDAPSSLHELRGASLVMLAPRAFVPALAPLVALRQSQGHSVVVAAVEDVYDEYSFGAKDPAAIRTFLAAASSWKPAARAALLIGDASYDPRDYLGLASDFVPTKLVNTTYQKTASDVWFADLDDDGVSELAIGRLPARSLDEARAMVAKVVAYERGTGSRHALFVSGDDEAMDFRAASESVRALVPPSYTTTAVDLKAEGTTAAHENVLQQWNAGPDFVNYIGHGSVEIWQSYAFFSGADAQSLTTARTTMLSAMTCLNGYFHDPRQESLAETLLRKESGGAVAVWALSTLCELDPQVMADRALVPLLFTGATLGECTIAAQRAAPDRDVRNTLILFGDPMTRIP